MIQVLIIDDHAIFREGLKKVINGTYDMRVADEAADGLEAIAKIMAKDFDVAVLDLAMPGRTGLDVLRFVRAKKPSLPVIIMSIHTEEEYAVTVLREGASGYLNKESVPDELIRAIRKATKGYIYISPTLGERAVNKIIGRTGVMPHESLSSKEYQVFCMIVRGKSIKEIAFHLNLARPTVSTYRSRILRKMNMKTNVELASYATKQGLDI
jgi:two-component system, NarL family, invasion response regulator UvrY